MTSLVTLGGILLMLGFAFWWAVRTGKRLNQAESLKERVDKVANVNEFNRREDEEYSIFIKSRYKNVIEFGARQTKRGVSAKVWGKRKIYRGAFIGGGRNSGKRLVFKKLKDDPKRIEALHGASLPREFHRQDMEKIFKKKIKTRFPILFKRAVEFQMMKAQSRLR